MPKVRVVHPVSFHKTYQSQRAGNSQLDGNSVSVGCNAKGHVKLYRNRFERFSDRVDRKLADFCNKIVPSKRLRLACHNDYVKKRKSIRFNLRHEAFSARMGKVVSDLKKSNGRLEDRDTTFKTLRNDIKLMRNDNPRANEFNLLMARLDVELKDATADDIDRLYENLSAERYRLANHRFKDLRHGNDLRMLDTMRYIVRRHQIARSYEMGRLLQTINDGSTDAINRQQIANQAGLVKKLVNQKGWPGLGESQSCICKETGMKSDKLAENMFNEAIRLRIQRENLSPQNLKMMNTKLLNVSHEIRCDFAQQHQISLDNKHTYLGYCSPNVRGLASAVRREFLGTEVASSEFQDKNVISRYSNVGKGAAHQVTGATFDVNGQEMNKVYKEDDDSLMHTVDFGDKDDWNDRVGFAAASAIGIDQTAPNSPERAAAVSEFDKALGFHVYVGVDLAIHEDGVGQVMDRAAGQKAKDYKNMRNAMRANPSQVQEQLIKKGLLDAFLCATDGHDSNLFAKVDGKQVTLQGIDPDYALGPVRNPRGVAGMYGVEMPDLPPVVDTNMVRAFNNLTDQKIDSIMKGKFADVEIQAAKARLAVIQDHVNHHATVISPDDWGTPRVNELLADRATLEQDYQAYLHRAPLEIQRAQRDVRVQKQQLEMTANRFHGAWPIRGEIHNAQVVFNFLNSDRGAKLPPHAVKALRSQAKTLALKERSLGTLEHRFASARALHHEVDQLEHSIKNTRSDSVNRKSIKMKNEKLFALHEICESPLTSYWQKKMYQHEHKL